MLGQDTKPVVLYIDKGSMKQEYLIQAIMTVVPERLLLFNIYSSNDKKCINKEERVRHLPG